MSEVGDIPVDPATPPVTPAAEAPPVTEALEWERQHATWVHLGILSGMIGAPLVLTLVLWLMKRTESAFVDDHGKEAVNFQISLLIYSIGSGIASWILGLATCVGFLIAPLAAIALLVLAIYGVVHAAGAAKSGSIYRYPMTLRLVH